MAGYKLQSKTTNGAIVDIPLAATYDADGNEISKHYITKDTFFSELEERTKTYMATYGVEAWAGLGPFYINIPNYVHNLGADVKVDHFNQGNEEFEWVRNASGNVTIYSNVRVPIIVYLS